jgi:hypothetical protein
MQSWFRHLIVLPLAAAPAPAPVTPPAAADAR